MPMPIGRILSVLLISASCLLYACASRNTAPAPAEPEREVSQGAPLPGSPPVVEQRMQDPAPTQARTASARQAAPTPQASPQKPYPTPAQDDSGFITLQPGETLSYISALYAVSEKDLIAWNGLDSAHDVHVGQRLAIRPPRGMPQASPAKTPTPQSDPAVASDGTILVAPGQSLSTIAQQHGVSVSQLRAWNGLTSDSVRAGRRLRVQAPAAQANGALGAPSAERRAAPDAPDADGMITVRSGQTLSGLAAKYQIDAAELRKWNTLKSDQIRIGQKLRVKAPVRVHTVREGESLGGIAARYKVSANVLMQKNKLANADMLPVGKKLVIP